MLFKRTKMQPRISFAFPLSFFANYSARENKQQRVALSLSLCFHFYVCMREYILSLSISNATSCGLAVQAEPQSRAVFNVPLNWLCAIPIVNRYNYRVTSSSAN